VNPKGEQVLNLLRPIGADLGATADRENFEQILRSRKPAIGGIGPLGPISGKRLVALRAPVERDNELKFVLTVALVPDAVSQILKTAGAPPGWVGAVVDAKGNFVARSVGEQFELGRPASQSVRDAIATGREGSYTGITLEGEQVDSIYKELPGTGGWSVHLGIPTDQLDAPVRRSAIFLAGGGAVSLALALALAWFTARDISQRRKDQEAQAALALKVSEERRRLTIDAADLGVFSCNFRSGEVLASARALQMLHLTTDANNGDASLRLEELLASLHPADRADFEQALLHCRHGKAMVIDFRTAQPDGRWLRASGRTSHLDPSESDMIFAVLHDIDETKRAELERQQLLRRLSHAEENERRRIARELHDQIGQTVTGLLLGLKNLEQSLNDVPSRPARLDRLHSLQALANRIGRDIHQIAADLRPTALDDLGLYGALEAFCSEWSQRFGVNADLQVLGSPERPPPDAEIALYRAVQEALNNVIKHAGARNVSVVLERREQKLRIIVEDDGKGFNTQDLSSKAFRSSKLGLSVIEERLTLLGGAFAVESGPSQGTALFMTVPMGTKELGA
jgi:two-component system sensor histidine kinase UhpB